MESGKYRIKVAGIETASTEVANGERIELWIFIDLNTDEKKKIEVFK